MSKAGALGNCRINGTAQPQARLQNWKTAAKVVGPRLKQRWSIGTLQQKWFAPALNEAAAFENQAKIGCPSLKQGWGIGKLQRKWYAQPWKRLGIPKLQQRSYSSALNKAGAFENCSGNGTPHFETRLSHWKTAAKMVCPSLQGGCGIERCSENV